MYTCYMFVHLTVTFQYKIIHVNTKGPWKSLLKESIKYSSLWNTSDTFHSWDQNKHGHGLKIKEKIYPKLTNVKFIGKDI